MGRGGESSCFLELSMVTLMGACELWRTEKGWTQSGLCDDSSHGLFCCNLQALILSDTLSSKTLNLVWLNSSLLFTISPYLFNLQILLILPHQFLSRTAVPFCL